MKNRIKFGAPFVLVILILSIFTGAASAHECYIFNRSDQGNLMAGTHSKAWENVATLSGVFQFMPFLLPEYGLAPLTPAQLDYAVGQAREMGFSEYLTFFVGNHTLLEGTPAEGLHASDLKGVEHAFDSVTGPLLDIYLDALTQ